MMRNLWSAFVASTLAAAAISPVPTSSLQCTPGKAGECAGETVVASFYGTESGNRTANGEHFDGTSMTAAHRTLPFGTRLRVTYEGRSVLVVINDRGPYSKRRSLDLSRAAAARLEMIDAGVARVCVERVG